MAYPWDARIWGKNLAAAQRTIDDLIRTMSIYERVCLLVPHDAEKSLARKFKSPEIDIIPARYNDIWVRDTLPTFAAGLDGSLIAIDWHFNGWGKAKGLRFGDDLTIGREVARMVGATVIDSDVIAEGGAFAFNGSGLVVATQSVLLDPKRNGGRRQTELETGLLRASQCKEVCWVPGDDWERITRGHADGILAFADDAVLFSWVEDESSVEREVCEQNLRSFTTWAKRAGRHYDVIKLPCPPRGDNYCASYVNFAHVNGAVMAPKHGGRAAAFDDRAKATLEELFGKPAILVPIRAIAAFGGGIHCATQHIFASQ